MVLEVKFKSHVSKVIEEIADRGSVGTDTVRRILDRQPEKLSEGKLTT